MSILCFVCHTSHLILVSTMFAQLSACLRNTQYGVKIAYKDLGLN